eukprot:10821779-Alexandrium_andersonii.AAC.1
MQRESESTVSDSVGLLQGSHDRVRPSCIQLPPRRSPERTSASFAHVHSGDIRSERPGGRVG